jgi:hypothetical protein
MMPMPNIGVDQVQNPHVKLELRLMHQWTAYTSQVRKVHCQCNKIHPC